MSGKIEVSGDVAQIIGGNVQEAPRQNNFVNFNLNSEKEPEQKLTDLQRKRISGLVKELCSVANEEPLNVYRVILTEFGAERMKDLPRIRYHDVVELIERWITETKIENRKCELSESLASEGKKDQGDTSAVLLSPSSSCLICCEKDVNFVRLQRISRGQWVLAGALAMLSGILLYKMPTDASPSSSGSNKCFYNGKAYSVGSTLISDGHNILECSFEFESDQPIWSTLRKMP